MTDHSPHARHKQQQLGIIFIWIERLPTAPPSGPPTLTAHAAAARGHPRGSAAVAAVSAACAAPRA